MNFKVNSGGIITDYEVLMYYTIVICGSRANKRGIYKGEMQINTIVTGW